MTLCKSVLFRLFNKTRYTVYSLRYTSMYKIIYKKVLVYINNGRTHARTLWCTRTQYLTITLTFRYTRVLNSIHKGILVSFFHNNPLIFVQKGNNHNLRVTSMMYIRMCVFARMLSIFSIFDIYGNLSSFVSLFQIMYNRRL